MDFMHVEPVWSCVRVLSQAKLIVCLGMGLFVLLTRSVHALWFLVGTLACGYSSRGVKRLLRQPRPVGSKRPLSYGMPSAHMSVMSFQATYVLLTSLYLSFAPLSILGVPADPDYWLRAVFPTAFLFPAAAIGWSRLALEEHTPLQVLAGIAFGLPFAVGWWGVWKGWAVEGISRPLAQAAHGWIVV